jgi:GTP pyrophosphokinase
MLSATAVADLAAFESDLAATYGAVQADLPVRALQFARGATQAAGRADALDRAVAVAGVLRGQGADPETVAAALLANAVPAGELDLEGVEAGFGPDLAALLKGLARAGRLETLGSAKADPEQLRKMFLAIAEDVRVVLIKLAERVVLMRGLTKADDAVRRAAGAETLSLFAPLANRLGVSELKWELEDFAFRFTEPDLYKRIATQLDEKRGDREAYIERVIARLREELAGMGIEATIQGRPKHLYSIFRKMRGKNLAFEQLYDIRATRVIVKNVRECYAVLGVVHDLWTPVEGEFDDYIASPKANDYRSLHTAVVGPEGRTLEVQIRTEEMHRHSEHGVAAHWRYKEGRRTDQKFDDRIAWLRELLAFKKDLLAGEPDGRGARGLFEDTIFVFTPQGRVVDLPAGSTPIDFAYHVHTDLGHRCRGAKVDGHMVTLTTKLANAQKVEITAAKQGGPSRDWLGGGYLASPRALAKVRQWFRHEDFEQDAAAGRTVLEKELSRLGATGASHERLAQSLGHVHTPDLYAALGRGEVTSRQVEIAVRGEAPAAPAPEPITVKPSAATGTSSGVLVLGVNNLATLIAKCCKPLPPDPIVGFVTRARGVTVHRADCVNITSLAPDQKERLLAADWGKTGEEPFAADIEVVSVDRQGLLRDISEAIARERINVTAVNTLSRGVHAFMRFTLQVTSAEAISRVLRQVKDVPGVDTARRL